MSGTVAISAALAAKPRVRKAAAEASEVPARRSRMAAMEGEEPSKAEDKVEDNAGGIANDSGSAILRRRLD